MSQELQKLKIKVDELKKNFFICLDLENFNKPIEEQTFLELSNLIKRLETITSQNPTLLNIKTTKL
jgi:hypothetical protein